MSGNLARLEKLFWQTARGRLDERAVRASFQSHGRLDAVQRMSIYRDMYFGRQVEALRADFPLLARELGEDVFGGLAVSYVQSYPSTMPALEWLGQRLPEYLRERSYPDILVDLANLEWLGCAALLSPNDPLATLEMVAPSKWPRACFRFVRSLHVAMTSRGAISRFLPTSPGGDGSCPVAVYRRGFALRTVELAGDEYDAVTMARRSVPFAEVCEVFDTAERASKIIRGWFTRQWVASITVEEK
jgi:hypothetical protein